VKDEQIIVQAQVYSRPLRQPTPILPLTGEAHPPLDSGKKSPVTTQLNYALSEIMSVVDRARLWTVSCIRPNDSASPNSFDQRRVKTQVRSLLLPDVIARRCVEFVADMEKEAFCDRYVPTMRGGEGERIGKCARANGWSEGVDCMLGHRMVWLTCPAWKMVEDGLRGAEKELRRSSREGEDDNGVGDEDTEYTHAESIGNVGGDYFGESADNLLSTRSGTNGTQENTAANGYRGGGLQNANAGGFATDERSEWPEWDRPDGANAKEGSSTRRRTTSRRSRRADRGASGCLSRGG
jgi:chitin synthase